MINLKIADFPNMKDAARQDFYKQLQRTTKTVDDEMSFSSFMDKIKDM